jgi:flagellar assembly protein FliH
MSSKLLRLNEDIPTILYAKADAPLPLRPRDNEIHTSSPEVDLESTVRQLEQEAKARADTAYREGRAAAEADAVAQATRKVDGVIGALSQLIDELGSKRRQIRQSAEQDLVQLSLAIARRILHRELSIDPEALLGLVKAASSRLDVRELQRIRLSSAHSSLVAQVRGRLQLPKQVEIVEDESLPSGGVVFETLRGNLDASIDTQLEEIERGLTDIVRQQGGK